MIIIHKKPRSELKKTKMTTTPSEKSSKSTPSLLVRGLITSIVLLSAAVLLSSMATYSFAQGNNNTSNSSSPSNVNANSTAAGGNKINCQSIATKIAGISIPNPSKICDVLILRQSPTIKGPGNMNMNKFSTTNSIVEVAAMSDLINKSSASNGTGSASSANNTTNQKVFVMGEFGLLEPQLVPMVKTAIGANWTIVGIHNHMLQEKPKMIFVHWSAQGDLNTVTDQIKNVLLTVSKVPSNGK
jgi:uncharacterized protein DUF1259